jgi:hypothetical protein
MGGVTAPVCNQTLQGKNYSSVALLRHNQRDAVLPGFLDVHFTPVGNALIAQKMLEALTDS